MPPTLCPLATDCDTDQETDRLLGAQRTGEDHQRTYYEEKVVLMLLTR